MKFMKELWRQKKKVMKLVKKLDYPVKLGLTLVGIELFVMKSTKKKNYAF